MMAIPFVEVPWPSATRNIGMPAIGAFALAMVAVGGSTSALGDAFRVPRWQPRDFAFASASRHANPFLVQFAATVTGPRGAISVPGFYDGDGVWKIRVAPDAVGSWSLQTRSNDPALDGQRAGFECVANDNPRVHGALLIDREHPSHFIHEDGARYYMLAYECDWLWALDVGKPELPTVNPFLDQLVSYGFNQILLNTYAHDTRWCPGKTRPEDYGPPPLFAWEGSNDSPDHTRFNLAFWQHYDRVMEAMRSRGIVAHIMIKVYNKSVNWPTNGSAEDDLFFRWVIARYAAFPNVVWDFSKEAQKEKSAEYKLNRLRFIRNNDPFRRLITVHDDDAMYDQGRYDELVDFRSDQEAKRFHDRLLEQAKLRAWPVADVEFGYEYGPKGPSDITSPGTAKGSPDREELFRRQWQVAMAGGYVAYYYTYTAWDVIRPEDTPPGYGYCRTMRDFFERTSYWLLKPADALVSDGYCLANPGKEYVVFLDNAKPFALRIEGATGKLRATWWHPFTGETADGGEVGNSAAQLTPPPSWGQAPVVLRVGD